MRSRFLRRAVRVAQIDAWSVAIFAGLTFLCGIFNIEAVLLGLGMGAVAWVEFRALERLRRLDPDAPRILGFNQLALAGVLIVYAAWNLFQTLHGSGLYSHDIAVAPELASSLKPIQQMIGSLTLAIYGTLIAVAIFGQGAMALYYFSRGNPLRSYLAAAPQWIVQMQRAGISL